MRRVLAGQRPQQEFVECEESMGHLAGLLRRELFVLRLFVDAAEFFEAFARYLVA
jgi:hypothetical protein